MRILICQIAVGGHAWIRESQRRAMDYADYIQADYLSVQAHRGEYPAYRKNDIFKTFAGGNWDLLIYLDCDVLIQTWENRWPEIMDGYDLAVVPDMQLKTMPADGAQWARKNGLQVPAAGKYFNAGVMVMTGKGAEAFDWVYGPKPALTFPDNCPMNAMAASADIRIKYLSDCYNWTAPQAPNPDAIFVHYAGGSKGRILSQ